MSITTSFLPVALGGALGASARHAFNLLAGSFGGTLPASTLLVNVLGSLLAGALLGWATLRGTPHPLLHPLLMTGFLGGFTTFSAFSVETLRFLQSGELGHALVNILLNVVGALAAVALGWWLVRVVA